MSNKYGYYFQITQARECKKLFCPSCSYAVSRDPLSGEFQHYCDRFGN